MIHVMRPGGLWFTFKDDLEGSGESDKIMYVARLGLFTGYDTTNTKVDRRNEVIISHPFPIPG